MKIGSKLFTLIFSLIFLVSLFVKTDSATRTPVAAPTAPTFKGLTLVKSVRPVNRGNFEIRFYQSHKCEGILALIALDKNEEGAAILAHYLKRPLTDVRFILNGKLYPQFPAFSYWLTSLKPFAPPSSVLAVKEFGRCKLIETTDWSHI